MPAVVGPRASRPMMRSLLIRLLCVAVGVAGVATVVSASSDPAAAPQSELPAHIAAERVALELAAETGEPVTVESATTGWQTVTANPDGTLSLQLHTGQQRIKNDAGDWVDVDFTMQRRADGTVAPRVHPRDLVLSGGAGAGTHDLARLTVGGHEVVLGWRGVLPEPELEFGKAVYRSVMPDVDLIMEVRRTGFQPYFVAATPAAAALVATVRMPWYAPTLSAADDGQGGTEFVDDAGEVVASMPAGRMWDAPISELTGDPVNMAPVEVAVQEVAPRSAKLAALQGMSAQEAAGGPELVLSADAAFLNRSDLVYPITVDPPFSSPYDDPNYDAFVQDTWSSDASKEPNLKLGFADETLAVKARTFLSFGGMNNFRGAVITNADLYLFMYHSWGCTKATWQSWRVGYVTTTARWTNQPGWHELMAESDVTRGHPSCLSDAWVSIDVADTFQTTLDGTANTANIGLRAKSETNHNGWKKFRSSEYSSSYDPYVSVTYSRKPNAPTNLYVGDKSCGSSGTTVIADVAGSAQPLKATVSDPDASGNVEYADLYTYFYVRPKGGSWPSSPSASAPKVQQAKGGPARTASVDLPASFGLVEHQDYEMRVRAKDQYGVYGSYSYTCTFRLDNGYPTNPPSITHVDNPVIYPQGTGAEDDVPGGGPGMSGLFQLAGPPGDTDVHKYRYRMISVKGVTGWTEVAAPSPGDAVTVALTPPFDDGNSPTSTLDEINQGGQWRIEVEYADGNNRWSPAAAYDTAVKVRPPAAAVWSMDDPDTSNVLADPVGGHSANLVGSVTKTTGFGDGGSAWHFDGSGSHAVVTPAPIDTTRAFSVAAWVKLDTAAGVDQTVAVKNSEYSPSFALQYESANGKWEFQMRTGSTSGTWKIATSSTPAMAGVWTHLAGTYDPMGGVLSLYVNGRLETTVTGMVAFDDPQGSLMLANASYGDPLGGALDEVSVWQRALDPREIAAMAVHETAAWHLDHDGRDTAGSTAPHGLSAYDGTADLGVPDPTNASWWGAGRTQSGDGRTLIGGPGAVELSGQRWLGTTGPVIDTTQSFSVSVWARLDELGRYQSAVAQVGTAQSAFQISAHSEDWWSFLMRTSDTPAASRAAVYGPRAQAGQWTHLVASFDAASRTLSLYVNGQLAGTAVYSATPWSSGGPFTVGRTLYTYSDGTKDYDYLQGGVDEVRMFTGVLDQEMVNRLYRSPDGVL